NSARTDAALRYRTVRRENTIELPRDSCEAYVSERLVREKSADAKVTHSRNTRIAMQSMLLRSLIARACTALSHRPIRDAPSGCFTGRKSGQKGIPTRR